jgi:putative iron-regulated protein
MYRKQFLTNAHDAVRLLLLGVLKFALGELSGERMDVAMQTNDQEDEHSCFSDNTHRDIARGQQGIVNVITGTYERRDGSVIRGTSILDEIALKSLDDATAIRTTVSNATKRTAEIRAPFDQEITSVDGKERVYAAIKAIVAEAGAIQDGLFKVNIRVAL